MVDVETGEVERHVPVFFVAVGLFVEFALVGAERVQQAVAVAAVRRQRGRLFRLELHVDDGQVHRLTQTGQVVERLRIVSKNYSLPTLKYFIFKEK